MIKAHDMSIALMIAWFDFLRNRNQKDNQIDETR
jgi:hypothetical protein